MSINVLKILRGTVAQRRKKPVFHHVLRWRLRCSRLFFSFLKKWDLDFMTDWFSRQHSCIPVEMAVLVIDIIVYRHRKISPLALSIRIKVRRRSVEAQIQDVQAKANYWLLEVIKIYVSRHCVLIDEVCHTRKHQSSWALFNENWRTLWHIRTLKVFCIQIIMILH